jgi:hypothetical protein
MFYLFEFPKERSISGTSHFRKRFHPEGMTFVGMKGLRNASSAAIITAIAVKGPKAYKVMIFLSSARFNTIIGINHRKLPPNTGTAFQIVERLK